MNWPPGPGAVLRASAVGNVRLMYPMISSMEELREANSVLEQARADLLEQDVPFDASMPVGAMIEVPSAAVVIRCGRDEAANDLARRLRLGEPPLFARVRGAEVRVNMSTILDGEEDLLRGAITAALGT